ncbi:MAG TPA: hypothetical protein VK864_00980, partial [Longimicrobiales bacterium]|nr:hypothetical protein [Longimicrobiales bacterium]
MSVEVTRRGFLGSLGAAGAAVAVPLAGCAAGQSPAQLSELPRPQGAPEVLARDEAHWRRVAANYRVTEKVTNLEGGYYGLMAAPVLAEFHRQIERVNLENSYYVRGAYGSDLEAARARVATALGADV